MVCFPIFCELVPKSKFADSLPGPRARGQPNAKFHKKFHAQNREPAPNNQARISGRQTPGGGAEQRTATVDQQATCSPPAQSSPRNGAEKKGGRRGRIGRGLGAGEPGKSRTAILLVRDILLLKKIPRT